jgi:uncharacterized membrane protein YkoI
MILRPQFIAIATALLIPLLASVSSHADNREQNELRHEVERGEVRPLSEILAVVREKLPGDVVKVEIEHDGGRWIYEFRVVDGKGRVFEVHVDARTAVVERIEEK